MLLAFNGSSRIIAHCNRTFVTMYQSILLYARYSRLADGHHIFDKNWQAWMTVPPSCPAIVDILHPQFNNSFHVISIHHLKNQFHVIVIRTLPAPCNCFLCIKDGSSPELQSLQTCLRLVMYHGCFMQPTGMLKRCLQISLQAFWRDGDPEGVSAAPAVRAWSASDLPRGEMETDP